MLVTELPSLERHPSDRSLRVVRHSNGEIVGVANDGTRFILSREDISILRLDRAVFIESLGMALGLELANDDTDAMGPELLVGFFERQGIRYPVYLLATTEDADFAATLNRLALSHASPFVVLTPTPKRLGRTLKDRLLHSHSCVVVAQDVIVAMDDGTLLPVRHPDQLLSAAAHAASGTQPRCDGVYPPKLIVFCGREFICDLTKSQMAFLSIGLIQREIAATELMRRKTGVIWKLQYVNEKVCNDRLHQLCTRLNNMLAKATTGLSFSFNAATGYVSRRDPVWATDNSLT